MNEAVLLNDNHVNEFPMKVNPKMLTNAKTARRRITMNTKGVFFTVHVRILARL